MCKLSSTHVLVVSLYHFSSQRRGLKPHIVNYTNGRARRCKAVGFHQNSKFYLELQIQRKFTTPVGHLPFQRPRNQLHTRDPHATSTLPHPLVLSSHHPGSDSIHADSLGPNANLLRLEADEVEVEELQRLLEGPQRKHEPPQVEVVVLDNHAIRESRERGAGA